MSLESIETELTQIYGHGDWILVGEVAVGFGEVASLLRSWGADRVLVVAGSRGVGDIPDDLEVHYTEARGTSIMDGIRSFDRSLVTSETVDVVDRFDPTRSARVLAPIFGAESAFEGREMYGSRRPEWRALEDKMTIDAVFESAGVVVAPYAIVPVAEAPEAAGRLRSELGTVWVADNRSGWHGGGEYTRWVPGPDSHGVALDWFGERADRVRVMPFLDGLPCSIHGFVTPDDVATFRPVEMLVGRVSDPPSFRYMGTATTWDPPTAVRKAMRSVARTVGRHLSTTLGYLGPFSIDGVATADGFLPTELNPRLSAGLGIQARTVDGLRLGWMTRALYEGDLEIDAAWLGRTITEAADRTRVVRNLASFGERRDADSIDVALQGGSIAPAGAETHGRLAIGDASSGSLVMLHLDQDHVPRGPSFAAAAVSALELAAHTWDLELGHLEPAPDVTR